MDAGSWDSLAELLVFCILGSGLAIVNSTRLRKAIRWWVVQAVLISVLVLIKGFQTEEMETYVLGSVFLLVKAGVIPWLLNRVVKESHTEWVGEIYLKRTSSLVAAGVLTLVSYSITRPLLGTEIRSGLAIAMALLFYGLLLMIVRKVAVVQVLGILMIDNGVFLASFFLTDGMPIQIELGVIFDVLLGVVIFGILAKRMIQNYDSLNVEHLNSLKG